MRSFLQQAGFLFFSYPPLAAALPLCIQQRSGIPFVCGVFFSLAYWFLCSVVVLQHNAQSIYDCHKTISSLSVSYTLERTDVQQLFSTNDLHLLHSLETIETNDITILNARPNSLSVPPIHSAYCFPISLMQTVIISSFDSRDLPPLMKFNLAHEIKHGAIKGVSHRFQTKQSAVRVWLLYFPMSLFASTHLIFYLVLGLGAVHYLIENAYYFGEYSADLFAFKFVCGIYGEDKARRLLTVVRNGVQTKLMRSPHFSKDHSYFRSRLMGLNRLLAGRIPSRARQSGDSASGDAISAQLTGRAKIICWAAMLLVFGFNHSHGIFPALFGGVWAIIFGIQFFSAKRKCAQNSMSMAWILAILELKGSFGVK